MQAHCALAAPDQVSVLQGPYHITEVPELFRQNVTEGQAGIPLHLEISVRGACCPSLLLHSLQ